MPSEIELVEKSNGQAGSNSNGSQEQRANGVEFAHQDSSYGGVLSEELQVPITAYASNELASVSLASIRVTPPEGGVPENLAEDVENPDPAERNLMREDQVDGLQVDSVTGLPVKKSRLGTVFSKRFSMGSIPPFVLRIRRAMSNADVRYSWREQDQGVGRLAVRAVAAPARPTRCPELISAVLS